MADTCFVDYSVRFWFDNLFPICTHVLKEMICYGLVRLDVEKQHVLLYVNHTPPIPCEHALFLKISLI